MGVFWLIDTAKRYAAYLADLRAWANANMSGLSLEDQVARLAKSNAALSKQVCEAHNCIWEIEKKLNGHWNEYDIDFTEA